MGGGSEASHGSGDYAAEARDSIISICARYENVNDIPTETKDEELNERLLHLVADRANEEYAKAESENTVEAWEHYMDIVPSMYFNDATERIGAARENLLWQNETTAWQTASERNSTEAMQKYLDIYPNGRHSSQAEKKLIDLEVDAIFANEHGELPPMERGYSNGSSSSNIEITNQTQYELTINYSGIESKRMVIPAHSTRSIRLKNGYYRLSASVGHGISPFAGTETLDGGDYSSRFYIITTRY